MTSSLVGSEMCIRDSFSKDEKGHPEAGPKRQDQHDPASLSSILGALMCCLLYTSDAADDM
eukprot:2917196-Prorocentrum_lima.AAC.1